MSRICCPCLIWWRWDSVRCCAVDGVNRAFVLQGLKVLEQGANTGLRALAQVSRSQPPMGTYQLGFQLGPRVNAGGRVGEAGLGTRLLTYEDAEEATGLAMRLDGFNTERRDIEATVLAEAERMAEAKIAEAQKAGSNIVPPVFVLHGDNLATGVIGIVASRLKDMYHRPVLSHEFRRKRAGRKSNARSAILTLADWWLRRWMQGQLMAVAVMRWRRGSACRSDNWRRLRHLSRKPWLIMCRKGRGK